MTGTNGDTDPEKPRTRSLIPELPPGSALGAMVEQLKFLAVLKAFAEQVHAAGCAPKDSSVGSVWAAMVKGLAMGLDPVTSMATITVINGRPKADVVLRLAQVRRSGLIGGTGYWRESVTGTEGADDYTYVARAKRADTGEEMVRTFSIADAKRAGLWGKQGPWSGYGSKRMLRARACGFLMDDLFGDVVLGFSHAEPGEPEPSGEVPETTQGPTGEPVSAAEPIAQDPILAIQQPRPALQPARPPSPAVPTLEDDLRASLATAARSDPEAVAIMDAEGAAEPPKGSLAAFDSKAKAIARGVAKAPDVEAAILATPKDVTPTPAPPAPVAPAAPEDVTAAIEASVDDVFADTREALNSTPVAVRTRPSSIAGMPPVDADVRVPSLVPGVPAGKIIGSIDPKGRTVLEADADGRPTVLTKARPSIPPAQQPTAPPPAPVVPSTGDSDIDRVKAALAAAKAGKKTAAPAPGKPVQASLIPPTAPYGGGTEGEF